MTNDITEIRAAIDVVIEYATAHENPPLRRALESVARNVDAEMAENARKYRLGQALCNTEIGCKLSGFHNWTQLGGAITEAVEATGARIVTGDEQPEDIAQLRAERDRYRAWIQDVARRGTRYDPDPPTYSDPEKRATYLAEYVRCMDTAMRETARRVLEGEGVEVVDKQPVGELIGYMRIGLEPDADGRQVPVSRVTDVCPTPSDGSRLTVVHLLLEAVSDGE